MFLGLRIAKGACFRESSNCTTATKNLSNVMQRIIERKGEIEVLTLYKTLKCLVIYSYILITHWRTDLQNKPCAEYLQESLNRIGSGSHLNCVCCVVIVRSCVSEFLAI